MAELPVEDHTGIDLLVASAFQEHAWNLLHAQALLPPPKHLQPPGFPQTPDFQFPGGAPYEVHPVAATPPWEPLPQYVLPPQVGFESGFVPDHALRLPPLEEALHVMPLMASLVPQQRLLPPATGTATGATSGKRRSRRKVEHMSLVEKEAIIDLRLEVLFTFVCPQLLNSNKGACSGTKKARGSFECGERQRWKHFSNAWPSWKQK
jgi:hypothetical protein